MNECGQCIHWLAIQKNIQFSKLRSLHANWMIVKRSIAFRNRFKAIEEVKHHFTQRHIKHQFHAIGGQIILIHDLAAFFDTKAHNGSNKIRLGDNVRFDIRFFDKINSSRIWEVTRIIYGHHFPIRFMSEVGHVGNGGDHGHVKFPLQTFLNNFHVKHAEEAAAEAETKCYRAFWLPGQGGIIELQFFHAVTQLFKVVGIDWINPSEYHWFYIFKPFDSFFAGTVKMGDGIPYFDFTRFFDS